jgi:hypothetical protein
MRHLAVVLLALVVACGGDSPRSSDTPPARPAANDPSVTVPAQLYALTGDGFSAPTAELTVTPAGVEAGRPVEAWLDGQLLGTAATVTIDAAALAQGDHELLLAYQGEATAFAAIPVSKGGALYVIVSTDWDDADNTDAQLRLQEQLHDAHPALVITHLVGPYTFTDPELPEARKTLLADWVKDMRDTHGDEIGLHLHPWCHFMEAAGVTCASEPSSVYASGDATGYTVRLGAYDRAQLATAFAHADTLFEARGLGKPVSFRAGGWTAEVSTLEALADTGYLVDSSALNWARLEEWDGVRPLGQTAPSTLYPWNMTQWSTIGDTSQPYQATTDDILGGGSGEYVSILEVPDNGLMVDYVTGQEMIDIFAANWPGGALPGPRQVSIGWHPPNFDQAYWDRLDEAMTHFDRFLAEDGTGPVVYIRMRDAALVWPLVDR